MGFDYIHSAVDDHSRLACSEIHSDEKAATCAAFLRRAADFLHTYNHHRCHSALGGRSPVSRVNNASGQYTWAMARTAEIRARMQTPPFGNTGVAIAVAAACLAAMDAFPSLSAWPGRSSRSAPC